MRACSRGGITVSLRDRLEVALVLHKMAITMLVGRVTPAELFARYDCDEDSYWSEKEQWNMLKVGMAGGGVAGGGRARVERLFVMGIGAGCKEWVARMEKVRPAYRGQEKGHGEDDPDRWQPCRQSQHP